MKKLLTGMGALLLSVMCLGVVSSANNDGISTQAIVGGGGGEPCTISGSRNYSTTTKKGTNFTVTAKDPGSVSAVGINATINSGTIKGNSGTAEMNANSGYKTLEHTATTTKCRYDFIPAKAIAGYVVNYTFTVRY